MSAAKTARLPDGRVVNADQSDPTGPWTVWLAENADATSVDRSPLTAVSELLGLPRTGKPRWVFDVVRDLAGEDTPLGRRFPCGCCDFLTLPEPAPGTHYICPVCGWQDDWTQYEDLDYTGGANRPSLREARKSYRLHGTSEPGRKLRVRDPLPEERPRSES